MFRGDTVEECVYSFKVSEEDLLEDLLCYKFESLTYDLIYHIVNTFNFTGDSQIIIVEGLDTLENQLDMELLSLLGIFSDSNVGEGTSGVKIITSDNIWDACESTLVAFIQDSVNEGVMLEVRRLKEEEPNIKWFFLDKIDRLKECLMETPIWEGDEIIGHNLEFLGNIYLSPLQFFSDYEEGIFGKKSKDEMVITLDIPGMLDRIRPIADQSQNPYVAFYSYIDKVKYIIKSNPEREFILDFHDEARELYITCLMDLIEQSSNVRVLFDRSFKEFTSIADEYKERVKIPRLSVLAEEVSRIGRFRLFPNLGIILDSQVKVEFLKYSKTLKTTTFSTFQGSSAEFLRQNDLLSTGDFLEVFKNMPDEMRDRVDIYNYPSHFISRDSSSDYIYFIVSLTSESYGFILESLVMGSSKKLSPRIIGSPSLPVTVLDSLDELEEPMELLESVTVEYKKILGKTWEELKPIFQLESDFAGLVFPDMEYLEECIMKFWDDDKSCIFTDNKTFEEFLIDPRVRYVNALQIKNNRSSIFKSCPFSFYDQDSLLLKPKIPFESLKTGLSYFAEEEKVLQELLRSKEFCDLYSPYLDLQYEYNGKIEVQI